MLDEGWKWFFYGGKCNNCLPRNGNFKIMTNLGNYKVGLVAGVRVNEWSNRGGLGLILASGKY